MKHESSTIDPYILLLREVSSHFSEITKLRGPEEITQWIASNPGLMNYMTMGDFDDRFARTAVNLVSHMSTHDWDTHEKRRGTMTTLTWPFELFTSDHIDDNNPTTLTRVPLSRMMSEVFKDRDDTWHAATASFAQSAIHNVAHISRTACPELNTPGKPLAEIHGSFARRIFGVHEDFDTATHVLSDVATNLSPQTPEHIASSLALFKEGPHDIDVKTVVDLSADMPRLMASMVNGWIPEGYEIESYTDTDVHLVHAETGNKIRLRTLRVLASKQVLKAEIIFPSLQTPSFCIDIAPLTPPEKIQGDFRSGPHHTLKRIPAMHLYEQSGELSLETNIDNVITHFAALSAPSEITHPTYESYVQALYAGLSLIRHEIMWPSIYPDRIERKTIEKYAQELSSQRQEAIEGAYEAPTEFRRGELIREGMLILALDAPEAINMMNLLGISDSLGIKDALDSWCNMPKNEFRELIQTNPKFTQFIAEMFDIEKFYEVNRRDNSSDTSLK